MNEQEILTWDKNKLLWSSLCPSEPIGRVEEIGHWKYPAYRSMPGNSWINKQIGMTEIGDAKSWVELSIRQSRQATTN
jgi:ribonucleotide reductase beta subunit family protein with ferritin-like domain